jgi:hypothetical protein
VKWGPYACPAGYAEYFIGWDAENIDNIDHCIEAVAESCQPS